MKNKDKYDLRLITIVPKYRVNGCGKKIEGRCWLDIFYNGTAIACDIGTKSPPYRFLLEWLEEDG